MYFLKTTLAGIILTSLFIACSGPRVIVQESVQELQQTVEKDPTNHIAHYNLGVKYLSDNKYDEAINAFNESLRLRAHFALAHFAIYCTEYAKSSNLYEQSLTDEPDEDMLDKINEVNGHLDYAFMYDPFFDWRLGTILLEAKPTIFDPLLSNVYDLLLEGFRQFFLGKYQQSIKKLNRTLETFPEYTQARLFRGLAFAQLQQFDGAIADFEKIIDEMESFNKRKILPVYLNPSDLYYLIGYAYLKQGKLIEAETAFQKVVENKFGYYMAHFQLSDIYQRQRNYSQALKELDAALFVEPNDALMHFNKGVFLAQLRKSGEAIEEYETAISLNPNLYEAIYNLAILQEHLGDNEEAVENFTKFIDVVPRSHQNYLQKAKEKVNTLNKN